jgi:hypothetical protein
VHGTRFRLFPVYAEGMPPETVEIPSPAGSIGPGPADHALYVADAVDKPTHYDPPAYGPPYRGPVLPPAQPDAAGNFDHIPIGTSQFLAAHLFGSVRFTLDIWEHYLERRIRWWDAHVHPQTELIPVVDWQNAQSGPGFIETGLWEGDDGTVQPFALNFDVIAHETGHQILFSQVGVPPPDRVNIPFLAFHESFSDLVAMIGVMHFPSVLTRLLAQTEGNLYVLNLVNRIGETSSHSQIRLAANQFTMADVSDITMAPDGSWIDPTGQHRNQHWIAAPLTGAIFDILVEVYHDLLVSERLIPDEANARGWTIDEVDAAFSVLHSQFSRALRRFNKEFGSVIRRARDTIGRALAHVMHTIRPGRLTFDEVAALFVESLLMQGHAALMTEMVEHFLRRGIEPMRYLHFEPVSVRGRLRRHPGLLRPQIAPWRRDCGCCHTGGTFHVSKIIRAAHATSARRR